VRILSRQLVLIEYLHVLSLRAVRQVLNLKFIPICQIMSSLSTVTARSSGERTKCGDSN